MVLSQTRDRIWTVVMFLSKGELTRFVVFASDENCWREYMRFKVPLITPVEA